MPQNYHCYEFTKTILIYKKVLCAIAVLLLLLLSVTQSNNNGLMYLSTMKTDFDSSIEKINIIPQDIGRVLLNLYNNAFYAVQQNQKELAKEVAPFQKVSPLYESTVSLTTKESEKSVLITVNHNGNGIPHKIVDKIFQPIFTTKPTGQGTGLGLSYDIVKGHGGEIKVESREGEGSKFIIKSPVV